MTADQLRELYLTFFEQHGHSRISGKSLIPENDPTVLFTTAGMHPLVPYILGETHPAGTRLVNYQKCIRTGDIDAVGDAVHLTFFEMLGNWSLGDYFKKEAISMSWEFLTSRDYLGIPAERLSVTVFAGDDAVPADEESARIWESIGVPRERIFFLPRSDNWWGPAGQTGPCGPDSEMFFDTGIPGTAESRPGGHDGKYVEIWNDVFMQYVKNPDGSYVPMSRRCVDTGMGIERTIAMLQGKSNVYETELFVPIMRAIEAETGTGYGRSSDSDQSLRIIADHAKAAAFIIGDEQGVTPSNVGQGYVLRRLIRRAVRHLRKLGVESASLRSPVEAVIDMYRDAHPVLLKNAERIRDAVRAEERKFLETLKKGEHEFEKLLPNLLKNPKKTMPGRVAFRLYDTFGFPIEITEELAKEGGLTVDREGFDEAYKKHQELSKQEGGAAFKGGLADQSEQTTRLHTATHLLHEALRRVLGDHVGQKGSNITADRLRFDFSHGDKMTSRELAEVERMVNEQIERGLPVSMKTMTIEEARESGAIALFGERYDETVKVYSVGDFSQEVCGGPHVENTRQLGRFRIVKEQSSSQGVRRIKATVDPPA